MNSKNKGITRANPALIVFTVDMSGSMSEKIFFEGRTMSKCEAVTQIVNLNLSEIAGRCCNGRKYNDYFNITILGYSGAGVESLLDRYSSRNGYFVTVSELMSAQVEPVTYTSRLMVEGKEAIVNRASSNFIKLTAYHTTPTYAALSEAYEIGRKWCTEKGEGAHAPIFINITDGEASDATEEDLLNISDRIKSITTSLGASLFVNIHIGGDAADHSIVFPENTEGLSGTRFAKLLYEMSSELDEELSRELCSGMRLQLSDGAKVRSVGYNTSISQLFNILQIGSISVGL